MKDLDIARWRLRTLRLTSPYAASAAEVVGSLLAVQAENPSQSAWAVACRTTTPDPADLAGALASGEIIRTHVLRPTWHYVSAADVGWLVELTGPKVNRTAITKQLYAVHGLDDAGIERASAAVLESLGEGSHLTRDELAAALTERGIEGNGHFLMILLAHLELSGLVVSGRPRGTEHTYALLAERVPHSRRLDHDEALAELALRYFTGHGPATERDLAYWATLGLTEVRTGLAQVRDRLDSFEHEGRTYLARPRRAAVGRPAAAGASAATPRRVLPRLPGLADGARPGRHRAARAGGRDRPCARRCPDRRRDAAYGRQGLRHLRAHALPRTVSCTRSTSSSRRPSATAPFSASPHSTCQRLSWL